MDTWANLEWHYEVHSRFGEQLVYYLLRIRPFHVSEIKAKLKSLLDGKNLESVRVFEIFGRNDLLIRAWLHPVTTREFPEWLKNALEFDTEIFVFTVIKPFVISSLSPEVKLPEGLLDKLFDEDMIQAVEEGHDEKWLRDLIDAGIALTKDQPGADPIKFFLAIRLSQEDQRVKNAVSRELFTHIQRDMPTIKNVSIYQGNGFCHLLLKGEVVDNFFAIGELAEWILDNLATFEASTETYIVALPNPLVETPDKISKATFHAIRGKNLLVEIIIPELYEEYYHHKDEIERLLSEVAKPVVMEAKKLVHDYLIGYLKERNAEVKIVLFTFFNELEEYLRDNHVTFAVKNKLNVIDVYRAMHYEDNAKHITLGTLFEFYRQAIERITPPLDIKFDGAMKELAELRNRPFHGAWDFKKEWETSLRQIITNWPRIKSLIEIIRANGGSDYDFTYLPFLH